jgi:hypothetical protein
MKAFKKGSVFISEKALTDQQHEELYRLHRHLTKRQASRLYDLSDPQRQDQNG